MVTKYAEKVKIYNHYTNYKGKLFVKTLCDLFNDAAEVQTELYKVDVDTLNAQGFTWMLHRLHILLHKMPLKEEIVTIETWPSGIDRLFALRDYRMFREDGEELVRATSEWMYIDMKRRRPLRLPENVIAMSTEHNIPKLVLAPLLDEKEFGGERGYFDPYQKPLYWYFNSSLFYTRTKDAHSGVFAVKVYPNGGSFFSRDENFNPYHIAIEAGGEYRLTYWYKGNVKNPNITVTVDWYKGTTSIKKETRDKEKATDFSDQWQQKTFTFKAPAGVDKAGVGLYIENDYMSAESGGCILIDDISFVQTKEGKPSAALEAPSNVVVRPQQREMELSWNAIAEENVSYQIIMNGEKVATTEGTSYIVERLEPGKSYQFSVCSVKGSDISAPSAPLTQQTQRMNTGIDEEDRVPYLYTVREVGTCPRTLRLFYHDLADPDAKIIYRVDGMPVTPVNGSIIFTGKGQHILQIEITETPERKWDIEYKLYVD